MVFDPIDVVADYITDPLGDKITDCRAPVAVKIVMDTGVIVICAAALVVTLPTWAVLSAGKALTRAWRGDKVTDHEHSRSTASGR